MPTGQDCTNHSPIVRHCLCLFLLLQETALCGSHFSIRLTMYHHIRSCSMDCFMITSLSNCLDVAAFVAAANFSSSTLHILKVELGAYRKPRNTFHWKKVLRGEGWISVVDCRLSNLPGDSSPPEWIGIARYLGYKDRSALRSS